MLASATLDPDTIALFEQSSIRTLLTGIRAASEDPVAKRAFMVLYEDYAPVRLGGDAVFKQIQKQAAKVDAVRESLFEAAAWVATPAELAAARSLFDRADADANGVLTLAELAASGLLSAGDLTVDAAQFMAEVDADSDGEVTFAEFFLYASKALLGAGAPGAPGDNDNGGGGDDDAAGGSAFLAALERTAPGPGAGATPGRPSGGRPSGGLFGRPPPAERFDAMVATFAGWEAALCANAGGAPGDTCDPGRMVALGPSEEASRLEVVLTGCFAGARLPDLVAALKVVYVDYAALRLAGDLVFKLMAKVVRTRADGNTRPRT